MKLVSSDFNDVVNAEDDIFNRGPLIKGLLNLFASSKDPLVLALDEQWGTGKSVFGRRLERQAKKEGFPVIYFDAFLRDYEPNVFISLAATVLAELPAKETKKVGFKDKAKSVGKILTKVAAKGAIRFATAGAVKASDFSDANEDIANEISDTIEAELDELIDQKLKFLKQEDNQFDKFRYSLESLATGKQLPLVFILDELDRCRPDYCISVLENIKHFFSVQNVHFLLLSDFNHLAQCVKGVYGSSVNSQVYLEKFVHARLHFPVPETYERRKQIQKFVGRIVSLLPDDGERGQMKSGMADFLSDIAIRKNYSLRRIERVLTQFGIVVAYTKANQLRLGAIIFVLCDLKQSDRALFLKAKAGTLTWREINSYYQFTDRDDWYVRWLRYFYDEEININDQEWQSLTSDLWRYSVRDNRSETAKYFANNVIDGISV